MVRQYRAYVVGPPVGAGVGMNHVFEKLLTVWQAGVLRDFKLLNVAGPVVYKQE